MARKKLLLKWSAFRYCPEKYKLKRKFTQNISSHVLKICTRENADIFNIFNEIYLVFTSESKYPLYSKVILANSLDYGTYHIGDQRWLRRVCAVWPKPSLFAHIKHGSRRRVQPKIRHLAPLDG